jgi:hypothetical protein
VLGDRRVSWEGGAPAPRPRSDPPTFLRRMPTPLPASTAPPRSHNVDVSALQRNQMKTTRPGEHEKTPRRFVPNFSLYSCVILRPRRPYLLLPSKSANITTPHFPRSTFVTSIPSPHSLLHDSTRLYLLGCNPVALLKQCSSHTDLFKASRLRLPAFKCEWHQM